MILSAKHLSIGYEKTIVQNNLNLEISKGELICVLGANGCGKSTLFRTLVGLQPPLSGHTQINDKDVLTLSSTEKSKLFSLVLTDKVELESTTVYDIVALGRYPYSSWLGGLSFTDKQVIRDSLEKVQLLEKLECLYTQLSDGEKQRVMIAKALAQDTPLVFLDEPTAHLDLPNRVKIMLLLRNLAHETNKAILLSTHELELALQVADKIWLMEKELGVLCGLPHELVKEGAFQKAFKTETFEFGYVDDKLFMTYKL